MRAQLLHHGHRIMARDRSFYLEDQALKEFWLTRVTQWDNEFKAVRSSLSRRYEIQTGTHQFDYYRQHKGMFSVIAQAQTKWTRLTESSLVLPCWLASNPILSRMKESDVPFWQESLSARYVIDKFRLFIKEKQSCILTPLLLVFILCWSIFKRISWWILRDSAIAVRLKDGVFTLFIGQTTTDICHAQDQLIAELTSKGAVIKGWKVVDDSGVFNYYRHFWL